MGSEEMSNLLRHVLDPSQVLPYVIDSLSDANFLSMELLKFLDWEKGCFFTLLPETAGTEFINEFSSGNVFFSVTTQTGIMDFVVSTLKQRIEANPDLCCVFDDVIRHPNDAAQLFFFEKYAKFLDRDVYYIIMRNNVSADLLGECLRRSRAIWHSLCILAEMSVDDIANAEIPPEKLREFCMRARLVLIGAYDGEGYIFWEPIPESDFQCARL